MSVSRRKFMLGSAAAGMVGTPAFAQGAKKAEFLVVVVAEGGWDVTFVYDPKYDVSTIEGPEVDSDEEVLETHGGIVIGANPLMRPAVSSFFSTWHNQACVVNGIWMGSIAHDPCRYRILTGTPDVTRPDLASIMGFKRGGDLPLGSVDLSGWSITGPLAATTGRIGTNSQIKALIDPATSFQAPGNATFAYPIFATNAADRDHVSEFLSRRTEKLRDVRGYDASKNDRLLDDFLISGDRGGRFRDQSANILGALTLGSGAGLEKQVEIGVQLLQAGLCKAVTVDSKQDWDSHDNNSLQHDMFNDLFGGLDILMTELQAANILDRTLVVVVSEMTRSPKRNNANGKDHWGHGSALFLGGCVRGSSQLGATDDLLESRTVDLQTGEISGKGALNKYDNLAAGILEMVDVDPAEWLPGVVPYRGAVG